MPLAKQIHTHTHTLTHQYIFTPTEMDKTKHDDVPDEHHHHNDDVASDEDCPSGDRQPQNATEVSMHSAHDHHHSDAVDDGREDHIRTKRTQETLQRTREFLNKLTHKNKSRDLPNVETRVWLWCCR